MRIRRTRRPRVGLLAVLIFVGASILAMPLRASNGGPAGSEPASQDEAEVDPWEGFNSTMFSFNHDFLDQYILKPVAKAWNLVLPDVAQRSLRNAVDNTNTLSRLVNSLAQGKFAGAGRELGRFGINSTLGIGGLFDVAKSWFGIEKSDEDTGQTLGFYGIEPGPYLVLPLLPPMDIRDGLGGLVDAGLNPVSYIIGFVGQAGGATAGITTGITATDAVNHRSLNLELYQGVEESVVDLYSAVRNAYLQKRAAKIKE